MVGTYTTVTKEELERAKAAVTNLWHAEGLSVSETPYLPRDTIYVVSLDRDPNKCSVLKGVGTGEMPKREEPDMASLTTYAYEVLVAEKKNEKGEVVRPKTLIQNEEHLLEKPTRESLLLKFAAELADCGKSEGSKITNPESEVVVNIRPFCG